jgi:hypothetical protein
LSVVRVELEGLVQVGEGLQGLALLQKHDPQLKIHI